MALRLIIFLILIGNIAQAAFSCKLAKMLSQPELAGNAEFWQKMSGIKHTDDELKSLIKTHAPHLLNTTETVATVALIRKPFQVHKAAEKFLNSEGKTNVRKKYDEFLDIMTDPIKGLRAISTTKPGSEALDAKNGWHHKTLQGDKNQHTIRLDSGKRILFEIRNGELHILDVGNHVSH